MYGTRKKSEFTERIIHISQGCKYMKKKNIIKNENRQSKFHNHSNMQNKNKGLEKVGDHFFKNIQNFNGIENYLKFISLH